MFELKTHYDQPQKATLLVEITMEDGTILKGNVEVPVEGGLAVILNGLNQFIELHTYQGETQYVSKDNMRTIRPIQLPEKEGLPDKLKRFMRSDPHQVLGVTKDASAKIIEEAYQRQLKNFHEILDYLDASYKGLNDAYQQLDGDTKRLPPPIKE